MSDNKNLKGQQDRIRVNSQEPYEVEDLHQKYPHLSHETVKAAVVQYGPERDKIEKFLGGIKSKGK